MNLMPFLEDLGKVLGVAGGVSAVLYAWLHYRLRSDFASAAAVAEHAARLEELERVLAQVPRHDDLRRLEARVAAVETNIAGLTEQVRGVRDLAVRIDRGLDLLLQDRLKLEQATR